LSSGAPPALFDAYSKNALRGQWHGVRLLVLLLHPWRCVVREAMGVLLYSHVPPWHDAGRLRPHPGGAGRPYHLLMLLLLLGTLTDTPTTPTRLLVLTLQTARKVGR